MTAAEIFDQGYRRFDGERAGIVSSVRSVVWYTTKSMLGIGRKGRHKVFPVIIAMIAFLPTVIIFGIVALFGDVSDGIRPDYYEFLGPSESFGFLIFAHFLYAVAVAPEAMLAGVAVDGLVGVGAALVADAAAFERAMHEGRSLDGICQVQLQVHGMLLRNQGRSKAAGVHSARAQVEY